MYRKIQLTAILALSFFLLVVSHSSAQEQTEMTISLRPGGGAHIAILADNVPNQENLKAVIGEPRVKGIYKDKLSELFGPVENLTLALKGSELRIEFDVLSIATERSGQWTVERKEFGSKMSPLATLRIKLPEGAERTSTEPEPDEVGADYMIWRNVAYLPTVAYGGGKLPYLYLVLLLLAIVVISFLSKKFFR